MTYDFDFILQNIKMPAIGFNVNKQVISNGIFINKYLDINVINVSEKSIY